MITNDERDFFHQLAARARQHRLDLIRHGWASLPTNPALGHQVHHHQAPSPSGAANHVLTRRARGDPH
jgi:hypothetical protein